ncbi:tetratricopeptide repeat protein [Streptomyces sp. NPDC046860]|uniref:tetratricopeptide repeat protein n=1 Tax=Streptomyces sp. NPDC046860 TaxID=3154495 RepID=UPI0033D01D02
MTESNLAAEAGQRLAAGDPAAALTLYLRAWDRPDDEVAERIFELVSEWGDIDAALKTVEADAKGGNAAAFEALAELYVELERPEQALAALRAAADAGRDVTLMIASVLADELGDRKQAELYYRQALAAGHPRALNDYGAFLSEDEERLDEAADLLRRAIERGDTMAAGNLGRLLADEERYEDALPWLKQALEAGHRSVLAVLGETEHALGDLESARTHLREALAEDVTGAHFAYALHLADTGAPEEAVRHYEAAAEEDGETNAYLNLALLHEELEQWDQADRRFKEAIGQEDETAFVYYAQFLADHDRGAEIGALLVPAARLGVDEEDMAELRELAGEYGSGKN